MNDYIIIHFLTGVIIQYQLLVIQGYTYNYMSIYDYTSFERT